MAFDVLPKFSLGPYNGPIPPQIPSVVPLDVPFQLVALALARAAIRSRDNIGLRPRLRQPPSSSTLRPSSKPLCLWDIYNRLCCAALFYTTNSSAFDSSPMAYRDEVSNSTAVLQAAIQSDRDFYKYVILSENFGYSNRTALDSYLRSNGYTAVTRFGNAYVYKAS